MASILTRVGFCTEVADLVGRSLTATVESGATIGTLLARWYERAQIRIARAYAFPELDVFDTTTADTVASTKTYTYSTLFGASMRVRSILSLTIEDGVNSRKLRYMIPRDFYAQTPYPEIETTQIPTRYTVIGQTVHMFRIPDAAYDIHSMYSKFPTIASGDSSTSDLSNMDDVIIAAMVVEFYNYFQDKTASRYWDGIFKTRLAESASMFLHPRDWEPEGRAYGSAELIPSNFVANPWISAEDVGQ
jgi:hypothetical protein